MTAPWVTAGLDRVVPRGWRILVALVCERRVRRAYHGMVTSPAPLPETWVLRTGLPTAVCFHDAYPLWPLLHDERDPATPRRCR